MSSDEDYSLNESNKYMSDESENFNEIMNIQENWKRNKISQKSQKLPSEISKLMGLANINFMNSKYEEAQKILYEIIRKYPNFEDPYHLLALICEEKSQLKKAAKFYTLAAELSQNDCALWEKIAFLFKQTKCFELASYCFSRALKYDPYNTKLILERGECYQITGDLKKAIKSFERLHQMIPKDFSIIKKIAKLYMQNKQPLKAISKLEEQIEKDSEIDLDIIHMISEIYISEKQYQQCLKFLQQQLEITNPNNYDDIKITEFPIDLTYQLGFCYAKLKDMKNAMMFFKILLDYNFDEDDIDLLFKIAEILEEIGENENALKIFDKVMQFPNYNNEYTWYKAGILYEKLGDKASAIDAFQAILNKNPNHLESKFALSQIFEQEGMMNEALNILDSNQYNYMDQLKFDNQYQEEDVYHSEDEFLPSSENHKRKIYQPLQSQLQNYENFLKKIKKQENEHSEKIVSNSYQQSEHYIKKDQDQVNSQTNREEKENYAERIEENIKRINEQYDIDNIRLHFKQARILKEQKCDDNEFISTIKISLMQALSLEIKITDLRNQILNRYLYESRKKTFKKALKSSNVLRNLEEPEQVFVKKSKKQNEKTEFLMKKKTKISIFLTDKHFENVLYMSKIEGRETFLNYILMTLKILLNKNQLEDLDLISQQALKLSFLKFCIFIYQFRTIVIFYRKFEKEKYEIYIYGVIGSLQLKKFEKAFYLLKSILRKNQKNIYLTTILGLIIRNIKDNQVYRTFISKLAIWAQQYPSIAQIVANEYLQNGFMDLSIKFYLKLQKFNPNNSLINLCLGCAFIQEATSRTTLHKILCAKRGLYFLNEYKNLRQNNFPCETYYNLGRAYSHLNMYDQAIKYYEKVLFISQQRSLICKQMEKETKISEKDDYFIQSVYNLIVIHKHLKNFEIAQDLSKSYLTV